MSTPSRTTRFFALTAALLLTVMGTPPAAAQTFAEAMAAYERGDYATALRWFRIHAEQGNASAQSNLAASRFSSSEQELREKEVRNRDRVGVRLTPAELAKAQRLVREWRPRESTAQEKRPPRTTASTPEATAGDADDTGARIANLQLALRRLGYDPGPADGILGARTRAAIRAFQTDAGLPVTGQISERLESAVLAAVAAAGQALASTPDPARRVLEREYRNDRVMPWRRALASLSGAEITAQGFHGGFSPSERQSVPVSLALVPLSMRWIARRTAIVCEAGR